VRTPPLAVPQSFAAPTSPLRCAKLVAPHISSTKIARAGSRRPSIANHYVIDDLYAFDAKAVSASYRPLRRLEKRVAL
jgi:hypothetical protein